MIWNHRIRIQLCQELHVLSNRVGLFRDLESSSWKYVASFEEKGDFYNYKLLFVTVRKRMPGSWDFLENLDPETEVNTENETKT